LAGDGDTPPLSQIWSRHIPFDKFLTIIIIIIITNEDMTLELQQ